MWGLQHLDVGPMADGFAYRMNQAALALGKLGESLVSKEKEKN